MKTKLFLVLIAMTLLPGGCTLAPKYERPSSPVPAEWPTGVAYEAPKAETAAPGAEELKWQELVTDERLRKVIETALANNRDLRLAVLNVERTRAIYGIKSADLLPVVSASGSWIRERVPADLSTTGPAMTADQYSVSLGIISWEVDFFGRIRSLKDVALEQYISTNQAQRSLQILLVSSVVSAYLTFAADRENLKLALLALDTQEAAYKLIRKRYDVGLTTELDLRRTQSQVDTAKGGVARYTQVVAQDENAINLLVGSPLPAELLPQDMGGIGPMREISPGLNSQVLLQRPDVLAAEHQLKAANANIGAARAAFFPSIFLTTNIGTVSADLSDLFKSGQGIWSFVPKITMPIFDARTWYAYDVTKVDRKIAVAGYEKAIQTAFREVSDALAVRGTVNQQIAAQQSLVDAVVETYRLSDVRYMKGIDSYLSVLDAQRSLYQAQQGLITLRLLRFTNLVTLYKALGGGG